VQALNPAAAAAKFQKLLLPPRILRNGGAAATRAGPEKQEMTVAALALIQQSGVTVWQVLTDVPHDTAAFVVYGMLIVSVYFIWRGSRRKT
jgi:hypothetical protein